MHFSALARSANALVRNDTAPTPPLISSRPIPIQPFLCQGTASFGRPPKIDQWASGHYVIDAVFSEGINDLEAQVAMSSIFVVSNIARCMYAAAPIAQLSTPSIDVVRRARRYPSIKVFKRSN